MWIEKTPSGNFKACERYIDPMTGKEKKVSVTLKKNTASSRKLAMQTLANKIGEKVAPAASHKDLTVSELICLYLDDQKKTTKDSTYRRSVFSCKNVKSFLGGDTLVEKLTSGYIRKSILSTGKNPNTMNELLPLVRRIRQSALAYKLANKSDLLFQDSNGRYDYNAFRKHFRVYSLGVLGRKCTPHILRHTHTSLMAEQGIPLDVISRRLGHSDSRITKEIYFHVTKNLKKKDDALFRSVSVF